MIEQTIGRTGHSELHAVFATCMDYTGERLTFRVGQPVDWFTAQNRWERLDGARALRRAIRWARRRYAVQHFEVRAVNRHGQGLGSDRHATAIPVPYRALAR
jgi:hypothetical protein